MSKKFELLVFDWDGTLMDSAATIVHSLQAAAQEFGFEPPPEERCRHVIGLSLHGAVAHLMPALSDETVKRVADSYSRHYLLRGQETVLFTGVEETLTTLRERGYMLAVATGKSRRGLDRVLAHTGLASMFDATRCSDEAHSKPHPAMLEDLMDMFNVMPENTLMIGDTTHDLEMARNAGTHGLAVSYGAHPREQLEALEPLACLDTPQALWQWLLNN